MVKIFGKNSVLKLFGKKIHGKNIWQKSHEKKFQISW